MEDGPASLEVRIKAEEEVLAEAFRAAEVSQLAGLPQLEPCEPLCPTSSEIQSLVPAPPVAEHHLVLVCEEKSLLADRAGAAQRDGHTTDLKSAEMMMMMMRLVCLLRNLAQITASQHSVTENNLQTHSSQLSHKCYKLSGGRNMNYLLVINVSSFRLFL